MTEVINKSDLMHNIAARCDFVADSEVDLAVREILDLVSKSLVANDRIEVRGFGTFCLHHRKSRKGRNPKSGKTVIVPAKAIPHFKPGKALRDGVNDK